MAPLHFQLDPRSGLPVYRQLMDQICYYVSSGVLRAGTQLPSIREFARTLAVNPSTIVKAYSELEHLGVIESRHGSGAFIADKPPKLNASQRRERLRAQAEQLAVSARQIGASDDETLEALRTALSQLPSTSSTSKSNE